MCIRDRINWVAAGAGIAGGIWRHLSHLHRIRIAWRASNWSRGGRGDRYVIGCVGLNVSIGLQQNGRELRGRGRCVVDVRACQLHAIGHALESGILLQHRKPIQMCIRDRLWMYPVARPALSKVNVEDAIVAAFAPWKLIPVSRPVGE